MRYAATSLFTLLALAAPVHGGNLTTVYENVLGSQFSSSTAPRRALDDGFFTPGPGSGSPVLVTVLNLGYAITGSGAGSMDIRITFYDTLNPSAPAGTPVNTGILGQFTLVNVSFADTQPPVHNTGFVDITQQTGGGILFPDNDWAIDVEFFDHDTTTPSTRGTPLFAGGVAPNGPTVGNSQDRFWRDANSNGIYDASDLRTLGGAPNRANFYLVLQGFVVPEPGTILLVLAGSVAVIRRRRSA